MPKIYFLIQYYHLFRASLATSNIIFFFFWFTKGLSLPRKHKQSYEDKASYRGQKQQSLE